MELEINTWLYDILSAIEEIESFIGPAENFSSFETDIKTKRAVERNIEIIGEAMSRILGKNDSISLSNSRKIVDTRNRIIHGYDSVSVHILWNIIIQQLPVLKQEVKELLKMAPD
jgi:uncharacterized protein with HEPN domain